MTPSDLITPDGRIVIPAQQRPQLVTWSCPACQLSGFVHTSVGFEALRTLRRTHGERCPNQMMSFPKANHCEFRPLPEDAGGEDELERARRQGTRPFVEFEPEQSSWTRN